MLPKGIAASGFPSVRETCRRIGVEFDPWQSDLNRCLLAKSPDGLYAADTAVLSIARQVGKTFDVGAVVFALCIKIPGLTVVWTAHRFKVSRETFTSLKALAKSPRLKAHIEYDDITTAAGNECIPFRNGSRIVFAARERGAIRGFSKVGVLILDEAQILTEAALADLAPTMNQAENPLIILMGTPPKPTDPGEVFTSLRADALAGTAEGLLYIEFSAAPGANPDDREAWRQANPSYPDRTPARAILRMRKLLSDDDFMREALGVWDSERVTSPLSAQAWAELERSDLGPVDVAAFGIDVPPDMSWTSVGAVGAVGPGVAQLELLEHRRGTAGAVDACVRFDAERGPAPWVVDGSSPAASLVGEMEAAGLEVVVLGARDLGRACVWIANAVNDGTVRHAPDPLLTAAVAGARTRDIGDGLFRFVRRASVADISPLMAVTAPAHVLPSVLPLADVSIAFL